MATIREPSPAESGSYFQLLKLCRLLFFTLFLSTFSSPQQYSSTAEATGECCPVKSGKKKKDFYNLSSKQRLLQLRNTSTNFLHTLFNLKPSSLWWDSLCSIWHTRLGLVILVAQEQNTKQPGNACNLEAFKGICSKTRNYRKLMGLWILSQALSSYKALILQKVRTSSELPLALSW